MTITIFLGSMLGAMALGMPIAFALLVCGLALMLHLGLFDSQIVAQNLLNGADNFPLMAIPFFILAGELMNVGGLSRRIVEFAVACVGHFRGGLGYVAVIAAIIMASLSGSAIADTAALCGVLLPMMKQAGYDENRSAALLASGGIIAPVIPPSIGFIIFGTTAGVSVTKLFLAGIVPGVLMGLSLVVTWWWISRGVTYAAVPRQGMRQRVKAARDGAWALVMPAIIIGGLKFGIFTPTEAGVVAAVYAGFVGAVIYRELRPSDIYQVLVSSAKLTAVVMFLVAAALVSAWLITIADVPGELARMLAPFQGQPTLLMFVLMLLVLVVGTALDFTPTVLILTPVLMPVVVAAGIDPVYFGVLFIINNAIGLLTPPVGNVLNVVCGVGRLPMEGVVKAVWPFLLAESAIMFLLVLFPSIVTVPLRFFS